MSNKYQNLPATNCPVETDTTSEHDPVPVWTASSAHRHVVSALAFSAQGEVLASGSYDSTARTWNACTGKPISVQRKKKDRWAIVSLAISPDGRRIASVNESYKGVVRGFTHLYLWDLFSRTSSEIWGSDTYMVWRYRSPVFSPSGDLLACAGNAIRLFDGASGEAVGKPFSNNSCDILAFNPDGTALVSGQHEAALAVWNVATRKRLRRFEGREEAPRCLAFSPDGRLLASGGDGPTIRIWDFEKGTVRHDLEGDWQTTVYLAFLPGAQGLVSFHDPDVQPTVCLWSPTSGKSLAVWQPGERVQSVAVSPDGRWIATGDWFGELRVWKTAAIWPGISLAPTERSPGRIG